MDIGGNRPNHKAGDILTSFADTKNNSVKPNSIDSMEEREDSIDNLLDTEYNQYNKYKDKVLSILGIGNRKDKLHPTMDTTIEELKKLWNDSTDYTDVIDSSDETPQPKVPKPLTIDGLHKIEGVNRWGNVTDTLHNSQCYIIEFHTHDRKNSTFEATIYREPVEESKIRIDLREGGRDSVMYYTHKEGFRDKGSFVRELFALADDYRYGK